MLDLKEIKKRDDLTLEELKGGLFGGNVRIVYFKETDDFLFSAKDCALVLGYKNDRSAIKRHVFEENYIKLKPKNFKSSETVLLKIYNTGETFISEEGLHQLINGSKMPKAQDFQRWVSEVIITFRKTGKYDIKNFKGSMYKSTVKSIPGYTEDLKFKHDCIIAIRDLSKLRGEVTGVVWNKVANVLFDHFGINVLREKHKFAKKNNIGKEPNTREYLDIAGYKTQTYIAFEILKHTGEHKINPEELAYIAAMCQKYYSQLNEYERDEVKDIFIRLFEEGVLIPCADYEAIDSFDSSNTGLQLLTFK